MRTVPVTTRLWLLAAVVGSYLITLAPLLLLGWESRWLAEVFLVGPSPLLAIAAIVALVFPRPILRRPLEWALIAGGTALAVSTFAMWAMSGTMYGLIGIPVAVVTPLLFWLLVKALRIRAV